MTEGISGVAMEWWENKAGKMDNGMREFASNEYVYYFDCGDDFIDMSILMKVYTMNMYSSLYIKYT